MSEPLAPVSGEDSIPAETYQPAEVAFYPNSPTNTQLAQAITVLDGKLDWCIKTLEWMTGIFNGLQAVASMMPGKGGKAARDMMANMNREGK
jgi:hypothetical protein